MPAVDDTGCMIEYDRQQLQENPDWTLVLNAYSTLAAEARAAEARAAEARAEQSTAVDVDAEGEIAVATQSDDQEEASTIAEDSAPPADVNKNAGWVCRLAEIEGISSHHLSTIHGKLIAFGFLNFELTDRKIGMRYQVTPLGRRCLRWIAEADAVSVDETDDAADGQAAADKQAA